MALYFIWVDLKAEGSARSKRRLDEEESEGISLGESLRRGNFMPLSRQHWLVVIGASSDIARQFPLFRRWPLAITDVDVHRVAVDDGREMTLKRLRWNGETVIHVRFCQPLREHHDLLITLTRIIIITVDHTITIHFYLIIMYMLW